MDLKQMIVSALALVVLALGWSIIDRILKWVTSRVHFKHLEFHGDLVDRIVLNAVKTVY